MNIDDLKMAWKAYDRKLESTLAINEKIIAGMIAGRSETRFSQVKRRYLLSIGWIFTCLMFSILVLVANPFDYEYSLQYFPTGIFGVCLLVFFADMVRTYATFQKISLTHLNVDESLRRIIAVYEKPRKFLQYTFVIFLFSQAVLFPLSFLPRKVERVGLETALLEILIPIGVGAILLFVAFKLGVFRKDTGSQFKEDFNELQTLKKMSAELATGR